MENIQILRLDGSSKELDSKTIENFRDSLRGKLLFSGDEEYERSRTIWNAMIDRKPALIVRCKGVSDIIKAVNFARENQLLLSIRGGGHNIGGNAVCNGGLMIDLSDMRSVRIDPHSRKAYVEPGATLGDFDREALAFGLAAPLGINSTTGVAGLTLGAGFGWLSRKYGMTIDSLSAVDIVTADGTLHRASESSNPDLFWAIRGGGGNFGVVTNFEFSLHEVGPNVLAGLVAYPFAEAASVLKEYRNYIENLGDETSAWVVMRKAPPLPFLPTEYHGKEIVVFGVCHEGDIEKGHEAIEPVRHFGNAIGEFIGVQPLTTWQTTFDPLLAPGSRNYWKSHNFTHLSDEAINIALRYASKLPNEQTEVVFALLGGAASRVAPDATAYAHRNTKLILNVHGRWSEAADDAKCIEWARSLFKEMTPYAAGGVYVNFLTEEETDRVNAAYGPNYNRLVEIKKKYDPENLFRMNQNIHPTTKKAYEKVSTSTGLAEGT